MFVSVCVCVCVGVGVCVCDCVSVSPGLEINIAGLRKTARTRKTTRGSKNGRKLVRMRTKRLPGLEKLKCLEKELELAKLVAGVLI